MLKIVDGSSGKLKFILTDDETEPRKVEEIDIIILKEEENEEGKEGNINAQK